MKFTQIRDNAGRLIATTQKCGDVEIIRDNQGRNKGQYNEVSNRTMTNEGTLIGRGNQLLRLLDGK